MDSSIQRDKTDGHPGFLPGLGPQILPLNALMLLMFFLFLTEFVAASMFHIFCTFQHMVLKAQVSLLEE